MSILPIIIILPLLAALVSWFGKKNTEVIEGATVLSGILSLGIAFNILYTAATGGLAGASKLLLLPYLSVDGLGAYVLAIAALFYAASSLYAVGALRIEVASGFLEENRRPVFYLMFNLFAAALFTATMAASPILMWIAIEATTLATVFCINYYKLPASTEAAWKYLIISSLALLLSLFGTLLFLLATKGHVNGIATWNDLMNLAPSLSPALIQLAGVLVFIGFGTKIGLVPLHTWKPDAYSRAPIAIVALFSTGLLNVAILALLRFKMVVDASIGVAFMQNLFIFFGALAIVVAALIILTQKKLRRLLAYHSIEHAGIIIIGFGFGGIAAFGALLHMLYYTTAKAILFFGAGIAQMKYRTHRVEYIKDMINILPVTSVTFAIGALALIGLPPFGLFTSEIYIFGSGFSTHPVVAIIGILGVALVFIGMLYKLHLILFGEAVTNPRLTSALGEELHGTTLRDRIKGEFSSWTTVPVVVLVIILIITGVTMPTQLVQLLSGAAGIIQ